MNAHDTMEYVIFSLADAMQIPLYQSKTGYSGAIKKVLKLGPWTFHMDPVAFSDEVSDKCVSAFMHVHGDLWVYFVSTDKNYLAAYIINGAVSKMVPPTSSQTIRYGTGKVESTLKAFEQAIVGRFVFSEKEQDWKEMN